MKKSLYPTLILILFAVFGYSFFLYSEEAKVEDPSSKAEETSQPVNILVEGCNDGDTCTVLVAGLKFRVRLAEIDAPEISKKKGAPSQPFSQQAKDRLNELVRGKYVHLKQIALDGYNRPIVEMVEMSSNTDVNLKLVEEGLAELYIGGRKNKPKDSKYTQAQSNAKKQKIGIWSVPNYISPYDFRRLNSHSN